MAAEKVITEAMRKQFLKEMEDRRIAFAENLEKEGFRPDVVTVDPPRKGLLPGTAELVASLDPERIVYVSCDPATLARDLKIFTCLGYAPRRACAVDMFPRTHHVESVVLLSR